MTETIEYFRILLSYSVYRNALILGLLVSIAAAMLGVILVLKRYSMIGDGLSHVGFGAMSVAAALGWSPMWVSAPTVTITAFLLLRLNRNGRQRSDAAIALLSSASLAFGVAVTAWNGGSNYGSDVSGYLFGSILSVSSAETLFGSIVCIAVIAAFLLLYPRLFSVTADEDFTRACGNKAGQYLTAIALLTAMVTVVGMRTAGTLLISGLILFPALSALKCCRSYAGVTAVACGVSVAGFAVGMLITSLTSTPAGAAVILADLAAYAICCGIGRLRRELRRDR